MADFLTQTRSDIDKRLKELRPLHEEYLTLLKAKEALEGVRGAPRRGPGRPRGSATRTRSRNGRRRRGGTTADKALDLVRKNPGITVNELSSRLNVKHKNYLYRVMAGLRSDGAVKKDGQGFTAT
jgi:hypothetical protein